MMNRYILATTAVALTLASVPHSANASYRDDIRVCEEIAQERIGRGTERDRSYDTRADLIESGIDILADLLNDRDMSNSVGRELRSNTRGVSRDYRSYEREYDRIVDRCMREIERDNRSRR